MLMDERSFNLKKEITKALFFNTSLSIASLSVNFNKSIPLVFRAVNELMEEGTVVNSGFASSTGGRRAVMYSLKSGVNFIVAVAMDQCVTKIVLLDIFNNTMVGTVQKIQLQLANNNDALMLLIKSITDFINNCAEKKKIVGIGIGMPGFVDRKQGFNYSFLESHKSICALVTEATGLPVYIDNDSSLIALAELKFGKGTSHENAMVINIGWGIGLGMILNGELFKGFNGFAGEFSHLSLFSNNKLCSCGKMGCLETETSLLVIIEKAKQGLNNGRNSVLKDQLDNVNAESAFELIATAAQKGDQFAIELISKAAYEIGRGVSILIHLLNPELVILSGRGALAGKLWKVPMQQAINEHSIPRLAAHTEIEMSLLYQQAELIGAAALVMENFEELNLSYSKPGFSIYENN